MVVLCHRCGAELPPRAAGDDGPPLYCARCAAPQLLLPEHLRAEVLEGDATTGAMPPPRPAGSVPPVMPGQVDWRGAIGSVALVAAVGAVLTVVGLVSTAVSLLSFFWMLGAAVIAVGLYARQRPGAPIDAKMGLRLGLATGLLMTVFLAVMLAGTGLLLRFGTHGLGNFDASWNKQLMESEAMTAQWMQGQQGSKDVQDKFHGFIESPEARAGMALMQLAFTGGLLLLLSAGGGAFAGMMRASQAGRPGQSPGLRRGE